MCKEIYKKCVEMRRRCANLVPERMRYPRVNAAQVRFRWTAPSDNGGCAMEEYRVLQDGVAIQTVAATITSAQVVGLPCASVPRFTVLGRNCFLSGGHLCAVSSSIYFFPVLRLLRIFHTLSCVMVV